AFWINVTTHPTADWIARQITEAFPWAEALRYVIRDRDCVYGAAVTRRLRTMGIRDKAHRPRLALAERPRRKADRIDPTRVRRPELRTHWSLNKDAPIRRAIQHLGLTRSGGERFH